MLPLLDLHGVPRLEFHTSVLEVSGRRALNIISRFFFSFIEIIFVGAKRKINQSNQRNRPERRTRTRSKTEGAAGSKFSFGKSQATTSSCDGDSTMHQSYRR